MASNGNHPQMAARFRLVKYYNLPSKTPKKSRRIGIFRINLGMQALQKRVEILMIPMPVISGPTSGTTQ